ncbi:MAG: hypothetical protein JKY89_05665 [Immundisolibacteraceae bacterium]|nr:hypothetical protein [Immundisolibacteraceae bacterium]
MSTSMTKSDIELLLPFYVNGTLDEQETKQVGQALAENKDLQEELVYLQNLQTHVRQQKNENSPSEFGLKRLQRVLQKEQHLNEDRQQLEMMSSAKNRWQYGAIAACLMLVVLTVTDMKTDTDYQAAGGTAISQHNGIVASVSFSPNVTEQQIRKLLLESHVFIVDGPSALGVYKLVIVDGNDNTIKKLATRVDLIESIQIE